jgi:hypothetical protein
MQLNWADLAELEENLDLLTPFQRDALASTRSRVQRWPHWFARQGQDYEADVSVLLLAGYTRSDRLCLCGYGGNKCGLWTACDHCRYRRVRKMWETYRAIPRGRFGELYHVTVAPARPLVVQPDEPADDPDVVWDACRFAVWRLVEVGVVQGAYLSEEWYVVAIFPEQLANPHVHILVVAGCGADDLKRQLEAALREYAGEEQLSRRAFRAFEGEVVDRRRRWVRPMAVSLPCELGVVVSATKDDWDLKNFLEYLPKVVGWAEAYRRGWEALGAGRDRQVAEDLNCAVRLAVEAWENATDGRRKVQPLGCLHPRHRGFLGTRKALRDTPGHRRGTGAWLLNAGELGWQGADADPAEPRPQPCQG